MKKLLLTISAIITITNLFAQTVTINSGAGDGTFSTGDTVYILSNPVQTGFTFDKWIGNTFQLADTFSISTSFIMPSGNANLTATYKPAPNWGYVSDTINNSQAFYYFPPIPKIKGLITFYHGHGGNASGWFISNQESILFLQYAVAEGYAVFATESKDRIQKSWDNTGANSIDIQNMSIMFDTLKQRNLITDSTRIFGVGMSQGSGFCSLISEVDSFNANALYCVPGITQAIQITTSPTQWCISRNDTSADPLRMQLAMANYDTLINRGIDAEFWIHEAAPVLSTRFWRIPNIDSLASKNIYDSLKANGYLDAKDFFTVNPRLDNSWTAFINPLYTLYLNAIEDEITTCFAEHKFHNGLEYKTIKFFDRYADTTSITTGINNFSANADEINIYPNPATNNINIQSQNPITKITITNIFGEEIKNILGNINTVDISNLSNGIYFIASITNKQQTLKSKIVVCR